MSVWIPTLEIRADWKLAPAALRAIGGQMQQMGREDLASIFFEDAQRMVEYQRNNPGKVKP